jgi:hypothetical protein
MAGYHSKPVLPETDEDFRLDLPHSPTQGSEDVTRFDQL